VKLRVSEQANDNATSRRLNKLFSLNQN